MMKRELVQSQINRDDSSLFYWIHLLNFFKNYKDEMSIEDLELLWCECERCREAWNDRGLNISQDEVFPNIKKYMETLKNEHT